MSYVTNNHIDIIQNGWNTYLKCICEKVKLHEMESQPNVAKKISYLNIYISRLDSIFIKIEKMGAKNHINGDVERLCRAINWNVERINELLNNY